MQSFIPQLRISEYYVVKSGLKAGDKIVFEGVQNIRDGVQIKPRLRHWKRLGSEISCPYHRQKGLRCYITCRSGATIWKFNQNEKHNSTSVPVQVSDTTMLLHGSSAGQHQDFLPGYWMYLLAE